MNVCSVVHIYLFVDSVDYTCVLILFTYISLQLKLNVTEQYTLQKTS